MQSPGISRSARAARFVAPAVAARASCCERGSSGRSPRTSAARTLRALPSLRLIRLQACPLTLASNDSMVAAAFRWDTTVVRMQVEAWQAIIFGSLATRQEENPTLVSGTQAGTAVNLYVGEVPDFVIDSVRAASSFWFIAMQASLWRDPNATPADQLEARDVAIEANLRTRTDDSWVGEFGTWTTIVISKHYVVTDDDILHPGQFGWLRAETMLQLEEKFRDETSDRLLTAVAIARAGLPRELFQARVRSQSPNVYFSAPGRRATTLGTWTVAGGTLVATSSSAPLDIDALGSQFTSLLTAPDQTAKRLSKVSRWLVSLIGETDHLKTFQFAFFGLELLIGATWKECHQIVKSALRSDGQLLPADADLPIEDLIWPTGSLDSQGPHRSLLFRFAVVSSVLCPQTARADTNTFKRLQQARNQLMHGGADDFASLPANDASELLQRYFTLYVSR